MFDLAASSVAGRSGASAKQVVEKGIFNSLPPLSPLPQWGRSLGKKPSFPQGVEGKVAACMELESFLNTLPG